MKTENRKREHAGLMESLELRTVRGRDRERETHTHTETTEYQIMPSLNINVHVCVFNAHVLYKSLQGLTEVLSYFNAL